MMDVVAEVIFAIVGLGWLLWFASTSRARAVWTSVGVIVFAVLVVVRYWMLHR